MAIPTKAEHRIEVSAAPEKVYDLIADLGRMGEWSPECYRVEWLGDAGGPAVGAEFMGHNRVGPYRWSLGGKVVKADRGSQFAFTTYLKGRESTRWRFTFDKSEAGTTVTESYEYVWSTPLIRLSDLLTPRRRMLERGMRQTLQRIKAAAEQSAGSEVP
jgi:uncharacterized protein YndB with AHSA1/START domain